MKMIRIFLPLLLLSFFVPLAQAGFGFVPGDYYTSNYFSDTITQYNSTGAVVGSFTVPSSYGSEVRGLTFGPENLLYATVVTSSGFSVLALDSTGTPQQSYSGSVYVAGNLSFGKISIDGQYLYVAGQDQLTRFLIGNPASGTVIYTNNQVFDSKPLPNGDLLVASAYEIDEITNSGVFVRSISLVGNGSPYTDIRGIEYNPATNKLFVSELGHTDFFFQVLRQDATTGVLEKNTTFEYADDLFLTQSGQLLIGSRTDTALLRSGPEPGRDARWRPTDVRHAIRPRTFDFRILPLRYRGHAGHVSGSLSQAGCATSHAFQLATLPGRSRLDV